MIRPKYEETISALCREIGELTAGLPTGLRHRVSNRLDKIQSINRKKVNYYTRMDTQIAEQSNAQIAARYNAKKAILQAMIDGRHISFLDSGEFKVSEMHTQMHCIARDIEKKNLPYILHREWFEFAPGKRAKMYHITKVEGQANQ